MTVSSVPSDSLPLVTFKSGLNYIFPTSLGPNRLPDNTTEITFLTRDTPNHTFYQAKEYTVSLLFCLYLVSVHKKMVTDSSPSFALGPYGMSMIVSALKL